MREADRVGAANPAMVGRAGATPIVARLVWLLGVGVTLGAFAWSMRGYLDSIRHPGPDNAALTPDATRALHVAGISLDAYAWVSLTAALLVAAISLVVGLALFWRRGHDRMALLVSVFVLNYATTNIGAPSDSSGSAGLSVGGALAVLWGAFTFALPIGVLLVFPSGRFAPRWTWWLLVAGTIWAGVFTADSNLLGGALVAGYPLFIGGVIGVMVYRYRRVAGPAERLQTKWVVAALVVSLVANQVFWLPSGLTPAGQTLYPPLAYLGYQLTLALVPIAFFIAIQRYHLYDIDTIINRALVYGTLTALLAGLYFGLIAGAQAATLLVTHQNQQPQVVIVLTTLLIAALAQPLRRGLQAQIDRRFYRGKYDAARTLQAFGAALRSEVELDDLSAHLIAVARETMQPERVSLWLRPVVDQDSARRDG